MFQLALDLPACESLGPGPEFRLLPRPPHRPPRLWSFKSGQSARVPAPVWSPRPPRVERGHSHGQMPSSRARRAHRPRDQVAALVPKAGLAKPPAAAKSSPSLGSSAASSSSAGGAGAPTDQQALLRRGKRHLQGPAVNSFDFRGSRPTTETEFIAWGPTGEEEAPEANTFPGVYGPTTVSIVQTRKTTVAATTATATTVTSVLLQTQGVTEPLDPRNRIPVGISTTEPSTSPSRDNGRDSQPPRVLGETSGTPTSSLVGVPLRWGRLWGCGSGGVPSCACVMLLWGTLRFPAGEPEYQDLRERGTRGVRELAPVYVLANVGCALEGGSQAVFADGREKGDGLSLGVA